jgi:hypothetical protein
MRQFRGNRLESLKQGVTGYLIIGGIVVMGLSSIAILMFAMGGVFRGTYTRDPLTNKITDAGTMNFVPIAILCFVLGLVASIGGVCYGLFVAATERIGPRKARGVKVLSRYCYTRDGVMLVAQWEIDGAENPRYYTRLDFGSDLGTMECECTAEVFYQCGEGMTGVAETQGKWLGSFVPDMGTRYQTEHVADDSIPNHFR